MGIDELKKILSQRKDDLRDKYGVTEIGLFGSYVKGEQKSTSDLDVLVEFNKVPGLGFIALEDYLSALLGIRVDLVRKKALKPFIGKKILEEVIFI